MRRLVASVVVFLAIGIGFTQETSAAIADISGVWTVTSSPSTKILIEKQAGKTKVAIISANSVGLNYSWYIGESTELLGKTTPIKVEALSFQRLFGRDGLSTRVVGSATIGVTLDDPYHGKLAIGNRSFDLERVELVKDGLIATVDPHAPETGWYSTANGMAFVEAQGADVFVTRLVSAAGKPSPATPVDYRRNADRNWVRVGNAADVLKGESITRISQKVGTNAAEAFNRQRFFTTAKSFVEDVSAAPAGVDGDGNGVRDDIDTVLFGKGLESSRVRDALTEIAAAQRLYMANPSKATALAAYDRIETASACIGLLAPEAVGDLRDLVDSLLFNTSPRAIALDQMPVHAGSRRIAASPVSLSDPNLCAGFMQGVTRRFDTLSSAAIRSAANAPARSTAEVEMSTQRASQPVAQPAIQTCADTRVLLVTGVKTDQGTAANEQLPYLKSVLLRRGVDKGRFEYSAFADQNPGYVNDLAQFLVARLGITVREANDLARTGFKHVFKGLVKVLQSKSQVGLIFGAIRITWGALELTAGIIAKNAVLENAADLSAIRALLDVNYRDFARTIAIAHSRGNLRMNDAYRASSADIRGSVAIASIANPDKNVADGGTGATRDDDLVMWAVRKVLGAEAATIFGAGEPKDPSGHGFIDAYLANPIALSKIIPRVNSAIARAKIPSGGTQRILATSSGGYTGNVAQTETYDIGANGVSFDLSYQAYSIPDRFDVIYRGKVLATTGGLISGGGTLKVALPKDSADPTDGRVIVAVYGPNPGTAWDYSVYCPTTK